MNDTGNPERPMGIQKTWHCSLGSRLSWTMAQVVVVVLLVMGAGLLWIARQVEQDSTALLQRQRAEQVALVISSYLNQAQDTLRLFESLESLEKLPAGAQKAALEDLLIQRKPLFSQITLIDDDGRESVKVSRSHTYLPGELGLTNHEQEFTAAMKGESTVSPVYYSDETGLLSVLMVVPVLNPDQTPAGALNAEVNISRLWQDIGQIEQGASGYAYIVDDSGRFIAYQELSTILQRYGEDMGGVPPVGDFMSGAGGEDSRVYLYTGLNGQMVIGAHAPVESTNWAVIVELPEQEAYAGIFRMQMYSIILMIVAVLAALLIGSSMARRFVQPIVALTATAQQIAEGELDIQAAGVSRQDELGILARTFESMAGQLRHLINSLEQRVEELSGARAEQDQLRQLLQDMIDSMPSILVGVDHKGLVTHWNAAAGKSTGLSPEQACGRPVEQVLPVLEETMPELAKALNEHIVQSCERIAFTSNGAARFAEVMIYPLAAGHARGAVVRVDDITNRIQLQELLIQSEKMMSVGGLAAGMAHEINNPLGGIIQGVQNLERRLDPAQDSNRQVAAECGIELEPLAVYLERRQLTDIVEGIRQSGIRASRIVNNMLQFSRSSSSDRRPHDLAELLDKSIELASSDYDLKKQYDFRHIDIIRNYDPARPQVICSDLEIEQVILNILKNSAQAMHGMFEQGSQPKIEIKTYIESDGIAVMEIADNGPGMEENIRRKVFEPFFTTKAPGEGTGLGLSVSYFIITSNHGGQISVESSPGNGSCFVIKLPAYKVV